MFFGENIKYLRTRSGLTQKDLGKVVGGTNAMIQKYEKGTGSPSFEILIKLAEYFDISIDDLVFRNLNIEGKWQAISQVQEASVEYGNKLKSEKLKTEIADQLIEFMKQRIAMLEDVIRQNDPEQAKRLKIE